MPNVYPTFFFALRDDLTSNSEFIPALSEPHASGYDVRSASKDPIRIRPFEYFKIPLGFRSYCEPEYYYQLHPRSSTLTKKNFHCLIGIVDETWEGETLFAGQYIPDAKSMQCSEFIEISFGEKIGQIIPMKRLLIDTKSISNEEMNLLYKDRNAIRGTGGFGSTGNK